MAERNRTGERMSKNETKYIERILQEKKTKTCIYFLYIVLFVCACSMLLLFYFRFYFYFIIYIFFFLLSVLHSFPLFVHVERNIVVACRWQPCYAVLKCQLCCQHFFPLCRRALCSWHLTLCLSNQNKQPYVEVSVHKATHNNTSLYTWLVLFSYIGAYIESFKFHILKTDRNRALSLRILFGKSFILGEVRILCGFFLLSLDYCSVWHGIRVLCFDKLLR